MLRFIILLLCLMSPPYLTAETALPKSLLLSYTDHPVVIQYHLPIIKQAYEKLGIKVQFVAMPIERGFFQLNRGATDGDVIRPLSRILQYKNLIAVGQLLDNARMVVFCRLGKPCEPEVLYNPENTILTTVDIKSFDFSANWQAKMHKISRFEKFYLLFKAKRFDYFTYVLAQSENYQHNFENVNYFVLADIPAYHVLHKKYRFMQEQVSEAIKQVLAESNHSVYK